MYPRCMQVEHKYMLKLETPKEIRTGYHRLFLELAYFTKYVPL